MRARPRIGVSAAHARKGSEGERDRPSEAGERDEHAHGHEHGHEGGRDGVGEEVLDQLDVVRGHPDEIPVRRRER